MLNQSLRTPNERCDGRRLPRAPNGSHCISQNARESTLCSADLQRRKAFHSMRTRRWEFGDSIGKRQGRPRNHSTECLLLLVELVLLFSEELGSLVMVRMWPLKYL